MTLSMKQAADALEFLLAQPNKSIVGSLVGSTGIGKTWSVKQVAERLGYKLVTFNASQLQEGDLALPFKSDTDKVLYALNHKLKEVVENPNDKYLVYFDELNRPQNIAVINELMTVINEGGIVGIDFPENTRFVAAMNPSSEMGGYEDTAYAVSEMDPAHYDRFVLINVTTNVSDWLEWGKDTLNQYVKMFFKDFENQTKYFNVSDADEVQTSSPRSWHMVSDLLNYAMKTDKKILGTEMFQELISGKIGRKKGLMFMTWVKDNAITINADDVLTDKPVDPELVEVFADMEQVQQDTVFKNIMNAGFKKGSKTKKATLQNAENMYALYTSIKNEDLKMNLSRAMISTTSLYTFFKEEISEKKEFNEYISVIADVIINSSVNS